MAKLGARYIPRSGSVVDSGAASKSTTFFSCREACRSLESNSVIRGRCKLCSELLWLYFFIVRRSIFREIAIDFNQTCGRERPFSLQVS